MSDQAIHPARDTLAAYGLGKLQDSEAVAVEAHLSECDACCETLLDLGSDTFVELVGRSDAVQLDPRDEETHCLHRDSSIVVSGLPTELEQHSRYRVLELLGKGGMGNVYKAQHTLMNRTVALKVIDPKLVQNSHAVKRFRREVQSAAKLTHPHIVTAYDAEQAGDVHFLVMEYVAGKNLYDTVQCDGPLEIAQACDYIRQAAQGLQHAYEQGMVHRDIKPQNLMATAGGQVKILDFGLAALTTARKSTNDDQTDHQTSHRETASQLTAVGSIMGTPDFIAPEQATDARSADLRSDIYSLGCTFYYLLAGRPPFTEGTAQDRVRAHGEQECSPIEDERPNIPDEVAQIVRKMMAKDPNQRFQTPLEVAHTLQSCIQSAVTNEPSTHISVANYSSAATPLQSRRHGRWLVATALAGLAIMLAVVLFVATDKGVLEVQSDDENVELTVRPVTTNGKDDIGRYWRFRIADTITGSKVKWFSSGEYKLELKGNSNDFEVDKNRIVLTRGGKVIVQVTRRARPESNGVTVRRVWEAANREAAPSPDGQQIAFPYWETGDLGLRNLQSGTTRRVTDAGSWSKTGEFAYFHVFSPDGNAVATSWWLPGEHQFDLRIIPLDGGEATTIYYDQEHYLEPFGWSRSGDILIARAGLDRVVQLVLVPVDGGAPRLLKSLNWNWPNNASISPDGRYVVYDEPQTAGSSNRDVFILSTVDGQVQHRLIDHPGHDHSPVWAPDGRRVVFTSNRNGSNNLWVVDVEDGMPRGDASVVNVDVTRGKVLGIADDGTYFYCDDSFQSDVYVVGFDSTNGKVTGSPAKVTRRYEGFNSRPTWSPEGDRLAFVSDRGDGDNSSLIIQSMQHHSEQVIRAPLNVGRLLFFNSRPVWTPDGQSILFTEGRDEKVRWGVYAVDVATSAVGPMIPPSDDADVIPTSAACSPDGNTVYFIRTGMQKGSFDVQVVEYDLTTIKEKILHKYIGDRKNSDYQPSNMYFSLAVSPDGSQLALASPETISVMPATGGTPKTVYRAQEEMIPQAVGIVWTRDGGSVVFGTANVAVESSRLPQKNTRLWQVSISDGSTTEIGIAADYLCHIAMHPDGNEIAYTAGSSNSSTDRYGTWSVSNFLPSLAEDESLYLQAKRSSTVQQTESGQVHPSMRLVWASAGSEGRVFADGRRISFVDWVTGDLAIHDMVTGDDHRITDKGTWDESTEYAYYNIPSPDGKTIACTWPIDNDSHCQFRLIDTDTGDYRRLYHNSDGAWLKPMGWTSDNQHVLVHLRTHDSEGQIVLFSAKDGSSRLLKSLVWRWPQGMSISPDGRYVAYGLQHERGSESDICILSTDGSHEVRVQHPADDTRPMWTPDGRGIVFVSDRRGSESLWYLDVVDGQAPSEARLLLENVKPGEPLGFTSSGSYFFRRNGTGEWHTSGDAYAVTLDPGTGQIVDRPSKLIRTHEGSNTLPSWSTNGDQLAYTLRKSPHAAALVIRDAAGNEEREFQLNEPKDRRWWVYPRDCLPRWMPDGTSIVASSFSGLFAIDVETGQTKSLIEDEIVRRFVLSKDGTKVYYVRYVTSEEGGLSVADEVVARDLSTGESHTLYRRDFINNSPDNDRGIYGIALSPDERRLAFTDIRTIYTIPIEGGSPQQLLTLPAEEVSPEHVGIVWTPIGDSLIFAKHGEAASYQTTGAAPKSELWSVAVDDGVRTKLNLEVDGLRQMSLHPDGQQITFSAIPSESTEPQVWAIDGLLSSLDESTSN